MVYRWGVKSFFVNLYKGSEHHLPLYFHLWHYTPSLGGQTSYKKAKYSIMKKLLKKEVCVLIIFALIWSLVEGCKLILTCLSPYYFTQSTHLQMFMLFLQTCPGCISEIWKKIWGRYLMEPLVIFLKRLLEKCTFQNFQQWFVMGLWWQKAKCSIIL